MPSIERVEARAYSRSTEIVDRVKMAVMALFPETAEEKVKLDSTTTEGYGQIPIGVITAQVSNKRMAQVTFEHIIEMLPPADREKLASTVERRLDDKCVLFLRLDKQEAYQGNIRLATRPDVIRVKVYLREYPRCNRLETIEFIKGALMNTGRR